MASSRVFPIFRLQPARRRAVATVRLGTDLVWIPEIERSIALFGERYLQRLFSPQELHDAQGAGRCASLAARVAAKEAVMKILRIGRDTALPWRAIEVVRQADGAPRLRLHGLARELAQQMQWRTSSLSMSHDHEYATATVAADCGGRKTA